jgi:TolB-like protein/Flp pilus assembly protein TadD
MFGIPDATARMIVIILGVGFIPALIFSWVFEFTPEGIKWESEIDRSQPLSPSKGKTFDRIIMIMLALALAYFAVDKFILAESRLETARQEGRSQALTESYGDKSIAVLPFVDMSAAKDQEYMSDGIAEEILNLLAKVPQLRVISRSSAFSFKGKDIDIPGIADQLNVAYVLEGSVRKAGDQVRITAQLIEGRSDTHLWSENYDRTLDDIFAIQDEIAAQIIETLKFTLLIDSPTAASTNAEAYDQYLLGQHLMHQRTKASLEAAVQHFDRATRIDPEYAPAHAGLAIAWSLLMDSGTSHGDLSLEEVVERALPAAELALRLDPKLAEGYAAIGFVHFLKQENQEALRHFDTALEINPNYAVVYSWRGLVLTDLGRIQESFESRRTAAELDPLSIGALNNYAGALFAQGRYEESAAVLERMKAISAPSYYYMSSWQAYQKGEPADALFLLLDGFDIEPENRRIPHGFANMFGLMGIHEESVRHSAHSIRWLPYQWNGDFETMVNISREEFDAHPDNRYWLMRLGIALLAAGDVESAMSYLQQYVDGFEDGAGPNINVAGYVALYRQSNRDERGAGKILARLKTRHDRAVAGGIDDNNVRRLRTMISLIEGRQADALNALDALSRGSGIEPDLVASLRALTPIADDARFNEILEQQATRWNAQQKKLLVRVCGDETWEEWDPLPGTCVSFNNGG